MTKTRADSRDAGSVAASASGRAAGRAHSATSLPERPAGERARSTRRPKTAQRPGAAQRSAAPTAMELAPLPQEPSGWVTLPDVAARLEVPVTKVHQMINDGLLIAVRREGVLSVPAELVAGRNALKHVPGVLTLLRDSGFSDQEALAWLYTTDDTLPGTPAQALSGPGATEVKRRAQALAL